MLTPRDFRSVACPTYPEIRLSLLPGKGIERRDPRVRAAGAAHRDRRAPGAGGAALLPAARHALHDLLSHPVPAVSARALPDSDRRLLLGAALVPRRGACAAWSRRRRCGANLASRGFKNLATWRRGVDTEVFKPRAKDFLDLPRPIAAYVGRVAVEKNIEAFLQMPWGGSKIVIGDGPERARLEAQYPGVRFAGYRFGEDLARASGGGGRHGVSEPHRHLRAGESRGHGLRRAGGRLSRDRPDRRDRGRRHRRAR